MTASSSGSAFYSAGSIPLRRFYSAGYAEPRWFEWNFATQSGARKLDERFAEVTGQALVWMASPSPPGFLGGDPQGTIFSRPLTTAQN